MLAIIATFSLITASACSSGNSQREQKSGPKTVHMSLGQDVDTFLPMDSNVGDNIDVLDVIYDGLVRYDPKTAKPYNYVAKKISSSKDKRHWTIELKKGRTFQNGEPVDASAFARAWNYAAYGPHAMANNQLFDKIAGYDKMQGKKPKAKKLSGLKVADSHTLRVELNTPFAGFGSTLGFTAFYPVAKECVQHAKRCAKKPIGNGPFQVKKWNQGVKLTATKWKKYRGTETPNYDKITWKEYAGSDAWPDFEAGDLDTGTPPPEEWQKANEDPDLKSRRVEHPGAALTYLGFPLYRKHKIWDQIEFRKAISMAIDRKKIIEKVLPGQAIPASSWSSPTAVRGGKKGTCRWCHYDPKAAKKALAKAGGWPKNKTLKIYLGKDDTNEKYFKAIGDQLKRNLGITYSIEPSTDFFAEREKHKFNGAYRNNVFPGWPLNQVYLDGYVSGDPKNGNVNFGYYGAKFEKKMKAADKAKSFKQATTKYRAAEKVLGKDFPTIPLSFSNDVTFYSNRVDHVVLDPFSGATKLRKLKYVG